MLSVRVLACCLCRLEKFFVAIASGNEVFTLNNVFSRFVLGDGLCCRLPAWENVFPFVGYVLDGNDAETSSIAQNFAHVLLVQFLVPGVVFRLGHVLYLFFLQLFEVNCHWIEIRFRYYG